MKQKHVDASRELRLWVQLALPIVAIVVQPGFREVAKDVGTSCKKTVKKVFKKKGDE